LADAMVVKVGVAVYPDQVHYPHFQFFEYARLTVIGVLGGGVGWFLVTRVSSKARRLYFRLTVLASVVLLLPDVAIWYLGQPATAIFVLVWMHVAVAVVLYGSLVLLAPAARQR
jgi:uncharacterized membrane protein YsdA (DUF1294 family)